MTRILDTWAAETAPHGLEIYYSGAWHDITDDLQDSGVTITRGRRSPGGRVEPSELVATLKNQSGTYSPRNPSSALYGLISRGTDVRYWVAAGARRLVVPTGTSTCSTPDSAGLSTTGDLDIRLDLRLTSFRRPTDLLSKSVTAGNQRSWTMGILSTGDLALSRSADGSTVETVRAGEYLPHECGRLSLRITYQGNNGAGGRTWRWYYSETAGTSGPWTEYSSLTLAGTATTTFDSTAPVQVGDTAGQGRFDGEAYSVEIRNGIGGTIVASPDFSTAAAGATTVTDGQGNVWTVAGGATLTNRHERFRGPLVALPQAWSLRGTAVATLTAAGPTRRMGQGAAPLKSPYYRACTSQVAPITSLVGYWPLTDGAFANALAAGLPGTPGAKVHGSPRFAADSTSFACTEPLLQLQTGAFVDAKLGPHTSTGQVQAYVLAVIPVAGLAATSDLLAFVTTGTAYYWALQVTAPGGLQLLVRDQTGATITTIGPVAFDVNGKALRFGVHLTQNGSNIDVTLSTLAPGASVGLASGGTVSSRTIGRAGAWTSGQALDGVTFGQVTFQNAVTSVFDFSGPLTAYVAEEAVDRLARLAVEESLTLTTKGVGQTGDEDTETMGAQRARTLPDLLAECQETDGGILYEPRDRAGLTYRARSSLGSQRPTLDVTYTDNLLLPFEPTEDDQDITNRVTITRDGGTSATADEPSGALGVASIGLYDTSATLSLELDDHATDQAAWRVHAGTVDEARWPRVGIELAHPTFRASPTLTRDALLLDLGDRLVVRSLPAWLPPFAVDQLVQGYSESITPARYKITLTCSPASVHAVGIYNHPSSRYAADAAGTVTAEALDTTETGVDITNAGATDWTHADGDYDIVIGGEVMTVTGVTGTGAPQTLTVIRSVNGVVKSHAIGASVDLAVPVYYGL